MLVKVPEEYTAIVRDGLSLDRLGPGGTVSDLLKKGGALLGNETL